MVLFTRENSLKCLIFRILFILSIISIAHSQTRQGGNFNAGEAIKAMRAEKYFVNKNGSITYIRPKIVTPYGALGARGADAPRKLCNMFGHMGVDPSSIIAEYSDNKPVLKLYGSFKPKSIFRINPATDYIASYNVEKTDGTLKTTHYYYHEISQITCLSLHQLF